ncbi:MAG: phage major capsid protein [Flavobacteriaceae bacterium]
MKTTAFLVALVATIGVCVGVAHALPHDQIAALSAHAMDYAGAMTIAVPLNARARGLVGVRADKGSAAELLAELQKTFETFKQEREEELKGIERKFADVVQTEKVDRINEELTRLQSAMDDTNKLIAALQVGGAGDGEAPTAEQREHAKVFNKFLRRGAEDGLGDLQISAKLTTDSDPDGGYVTPAEMSTMIDRVQETYSRMRQIAQVMSVSSSEFKKLVNQGGTGYGWVGEKEARSETDTPTLAELKFPAMELYANPAATQRLLDDANVNVEQWLADEVGIVFAEGEGAAWISGDGVNKPRGILQYDTIADASYSWGKLGFIASGVAADINDSTHNGVDALTDLTYALKQSYRMGANFLMNRGLVGKVRKLKTIGDTEGYLWQPSVQVGEPSTLLGFPVYDDDNMPNVGSNAFPIAFGNFRRGYLIVDRFGIRVLRDPYTNKPNVHFYTTKRVGGGVQNFEAIKLLKCSA